MAEGGEVSDADSDETRIEGSVDESDLEEEELQGKSLPLMGKNMTLATENSIAPRKRNVHTEKLSPEIQFINQHSINQPTLRQMLYKEISEEKESQSLLQVGINCPVIATDICPPDCAQPATVHGEYKHSICLDSEMSGALEKTHRNLAQMLSDEEDSQETSLLSGLDAVLSSSKKSVPKYPEVSEVLQCAWITSNKKDMTESDLPHETEGSSVINNGIMTEKFAVKALMEPLSDSETLQMLDPLRYQDDTATADSCLNKEGDTLPAELITALNSCSESVAASVVSQQVGNGNRLNMAEKQLMPDQTDDDCTQVTDMQHLQETETLKRDKLPCLSEELIDHDHYVHKLAHSDNQNIIADNQLVVKENSILKDTSSSEQLIQVTSYALRNSAQKRKDITVNYIDATSNFQHFLTEKIHCCKAQTEIFNIEDKSDESSQVEIGFPLDVNTKSEQVRKSQRIARKSRKQTIYKNHSLNSSCNCVPLSTLNRRDIFGQTLLHRAAMENDLESISAMIKAGANINIQDNAGWTPLHETSVAGCFETTNVLLKAGADVNCRGSEQITPLQEAVKEGHYKVAELLLWHGADPLFKNEKGKSALEEATDKHMRKLLESYISKSNRRSASAKKIVEDPVSDQSRINKSQRQTKAKTSSGERVLQSSTYNTKILKQDSVKLEKNKKTRNSGSSSDSKRQNNYRTSNAATLNGTSLVSKAKQPIREEPPSSLRISDSSHPGEKEKTSGQPLCTTTAKINKRNAKGETCLHLAAIKGDLSLVKSLIASGACVNQKDNAGWTAIHEASNRGFTEIIAELLKAGADVNSKNLDGILPIHDAVSGNHFEAVQLLLLHGANPNELNNCGENALDEATCSKMKELLKSHGASETRMTPCMSNEVGEKEICPLRSRKTHTCYDCLEKDNLSPLNTAKQKCGTHKSISKILQDIKEKQDRLLLFEVKSQRDAGVYIQDLSQIQNILNAVLAKQKSERDDLAKKYRASAESFKQGVLRKQLVKLVSTQKSLLVMAQKQKELGQKIQKYKNMKGVCSRKQVQSTLGACESSNTVTSKRVACPDSDTGLETSWVMESRFLEQDPNQHPNRSLNISGGNGEAINEKEVSPQSLVIEDKLGEYNIVETVNSKSSDPLHQATLPSDLVVCCSQPPYLEEIDFISVTSQGKKVPNATPRICTLNSSVVGSVSVDNINLLATKAQHVSTNGPLKQDSNINAASHMQPALELESTHPATHQKNIVTNNRISLNANLEPTGTVFHALKQLNPKASRRKRNQLLDLLDQGKIKPGDDVLEFVLQNSKHNASLLENGKIRTGNSTVYQNPTQWIKALLGNDITVSWKYVCNKVTYCGTLLSKIIAEADVPKEPELLFQQKKLFGRNSTDWDQSQDADYYCLTDEMTSCQHVDNIQQKGAPFSQIEMEVEISTSPEVETEETHSAISNINSSYQLNSSKKPRRFLQFSRIALIKDEEFLPCHVMKQYWDFYVSCKNFGF